MLIKKKSYYWIVLSIFFISSCSEINNQTSIPKSAGQMILVLTDSTTATKGFLYYFERNSPESDWKMLSGKIPIVLGRNGLGWGTGLQDFSNRLNYPVKVEGDGRSPAGIFSLSSVFGYESVDKMNHLKMPYIHITEFVECIDDENSEYYNRIVSRDSIEKVNQVDWKSSEKMNEAGIYYALGVVVDYNIDPVNNGSGSCIFLHNWAEPNETSAVCTELDPLKMNEIVNWLDKNQNPILLQLTKGLYAELVTKGELPKLINGY